METSRDLLKVYEINHNGFENFHTNFHALPLRGGANSRMETIT